MASAYLIEIGRFYTNDPCIFKIVSSLKAGEDFLARDGFVKCPEPVNKGLWEKRMPSGYIWAKFHGECKVKPKKFEID